MKKIAYILTTYPCPSETFIQREITQLKKLGFEIAVFAISGKNEKLLPMQNKNVYYRPSFFSLSAALAIVCTVLKHPVRLLKAAALVIRLLISSPKEAATALFNFHTICFFARTAEELHIRHIHACFLSWPACIGLGVSTLTKLPFSITAHARDIFVESGNVKIKAQKAEFISCCNRQGLECLKKNINRNYHNKLFLNYHGVEPGQPYEKFNVCRKEPSEFIIAVGRLIEKKGFDCLIEAFSKIVKIRSDVSLLIAGDGPMKNQLERMIEKAGLSGKVYLTGWLDHSHIMKLITQAKILIAPSIIDVNGDRDGIPNVILEAFSVGTAVIASNLTGISEAVINEETGLLVKPGDKAQLTATIDNLL
ncbi:MAG TPA: glycosyltransferase family 4 protein, partial [Sedimentisphaerales bacterium]|nr:glycosyltransferase family 4 protein [Sedimentisphaerales bacterium]